jgi:hypothetical protein
MNARDRFLAVMNFEPGIRTLKWEMGYWIAAMRRWYGEGLTRTYGVEDRWLDGDSASGPANGWWLERQRDLDVLVTLDLDNGIERIPVNNIFAPKFPEKILEQQEDWFIRQDEYGILRKEATGRASLPRYIGWPVKNRDDWEKLKAERMQPALVNRIPASWDADLKRWKGRTWPLAIAGFPGGFFGTPRNILGEENLLLSYYDEPELIRTIIDDLCTFWIELYDKVLDQTDADLALLWEDMSYKTGSLISPKLVREFMLPAYKRLTGFFRERGVKNVLLDTDGDCWELIPIFMEGGVTGVYPFEVNANMDVVAVRKAFPTLQMMGGMDKVQLAKGVDAIDRELEAKIPFMLQQGGFIPHVDHHVPPDVSWQNFVYYRTRLNDMIEASGR